MGFRAAGLIALACAAHAAQTSAQGFPQEQVRKGAGIYAQNCAPCHGARMLDPNSAFDLRTFPPGEKSRFVRSVTKGLNSMPPWGDLLTSDDVDALWAYVRTGQ